jgi:hypothetical protein
MLNVTRCVPTEYGTHRYLLEIGLGGDGGRLVVVMKNPSQASATRSDPTIGKMTAWASRRNYSSVACVNLFGYRSPYPDRLNAHPYEYVVGAENDFYIGEAVADAATVVVAWGNPNGILPAYYDRRIAEVTRLLSAIPLSMVGALTQHGYPRHARMWNNAPDLAQFTGSCYRN